MASFTAFIDGEQIDPQEISGLEGASVTFREEDGGGQNAKSISGEFEVTGAAYEIFRTKILIHDDGRLKSLDFRLMENCCNIEVFDGEIKGSDVEWCEGECSVRFSAVQKEREFDCLRSTIVSESERMKSNAVPTFFTFQLYPRISYCVDPKPNGLYVVILFFGALLYWLSIILAPVIAAVSIVIIIVCAVNDFLESIGFAKKKCAKELKDGIFDDYLKFLKHLDDKILGCGKEHPSPHVKSYIKNVCKICGLGFRSSILDNPSSPYDNTLFLNCPNEDGTRDLSVRMIPENIPLISGSEFLDLLKQPFNSKWRIRNGEVIFERKDFFQSGEIWIDAEDLGDDLLDQCYEFSGDTIPALGKFEYQTDGSDECGNEASKYYNEIVEWNQDANPVKTGTHHVSLPFARSRFRDDNVLPDVLEIDLLKIQPPLPYRAEIIASEGSMYISKGMSLNPKLIIWDGKGHINAKVRRYTGVPGVNRYNYPYVFQEHSGETPATYSGENLQMTIKKNMYHNFHQIDDPNRGDLKTRDYKVRFIYDCQQITSFKFGKLIRMPFFGGVKEGTIESLTVNFDKQEMTVNGKI